jgi:hypothetical protein
VSNHWLNSELSQRIRQRIIAGSLPSDPAMRSYGGLGKGKNCVCCDRKIADFNIQQVLEMSAQPGAPDLSMHSSCFDLWRETAADMLRQGSSR